MCGGGGNGDASHKTLQVHTCNYDGDGWKKIVVIGQQVDHPDCSMPLVVSCSCQSSRSHKITCHTVVVSLKIECSKLTRTLFTVLAMMAIMEKIRERASYSLAAVHILQGTLFSYSDNCVSEQCLLSVEQTPVSQCIMHHLESLPLHSLQNK